MKGLLVFSILVLIFVGGGCATTAEYNPVAAMQEETFLLNQSELARVTIGMQQSDVHKIMGDSLIIGYTSQDLEEASTLNPTSNRESEYKPITIPNPYKSEDIRTRNGVYTVEYYVTSIKQPDGIVSEDELTPLIFHKGILVGKTGAYLKDLRAHSSS